jgi:hypothetical protein
MQLVSIIIKLAMFSPLKCHQNILCDMAYYKPQGTKHPLSSVQ